MTVPLGNSSSTSYDKRNLSTTFTDALNGVTSQAYDAAGRLLSITDPVNSKTQYPYYANDTLQAVTDPLGKVTSFTYYADDMVQQKTDRLGRTSNYVYDNNARLTSEIWKDNLGVTVDTRSFSYDVAGNMLIASNDAGAYGFTYDALNRVSTVTQPFGLTLSNVYDAADNRLSVTDNMGGVTTSTYDGLNRLSSRELSGTGITPLKAIWDYDAAGNVSKLTRQTNGITVGTMDTSHDILHRTTEIHHKNAIGVTLGKYEYTSYDAGDRLLSQTIDGVVTNYAYDKTNQLTQDGGTSYSYDANGNRTNGSYTVGPNNQIITDGTWTYTYDNASQTSSKSDGVTAWNYNYDHNGQMIEAGNGMDTVTYTFDVFGNRIERTHDNGSAINIEKFAFDGGDTAKPRPVGNEQFDTYADLEGSNNVTTRRMYGAGFDELVVRRDAAGNAGWYFADKLNSVRAIGDDAGMAVATATYSAFGESVTTGAIDRYQYTSQERDGVLGLDYSNARMRDPVTSMFLNEDPMSFAAGDPNLRRYVGNGATNATDPSGMDQYDDEDSHYQDIFNKASVSRLQTQKRAFEITNEYFSTALEDGAPQSSAFRIMNRKIELLGRIYDADTRIMQIALDQRVEIARKRQFENSTNSPSRMQSIQGKEAVDRNRMIEMAKNYERNRPVMRALTPYEIRKIDYENRKVPVPSEAEQFHTFLDMVGFCPVLGEPADGINAIVYLAEGKNEEFILSSLAMAPGLGMAATSLKWRRRAIKVADEIPAPSRIKINGECVEAKHYIPEPLHQGRGSRVTRSSQPLINTAPSSGLNQLLHLTDDAGQIGIAKTGTIKGAHGIFTVPAYVARESTTLKVIRTGLTPGKTKNAIPIPDKALELFKRPVPIGPYSGWKFFGGVRYAPAGSLNTATGAISKTSTLVGPKVLIYGPDGIFYVGIATAGGLYIYGQTGENK